MISTFFSDYNFHISWLNPSNKLYTLWQFNLISYWKWHFYSWFAFWKPWFSKAIFVYQRVSNRAHPHPASLAASFRLEPSVAFSSAEWIGHWSSGVVALQLQAPIRGNLVGKLPSYGRLSMASCLTIMATTSSSQSSCQSHSWEVWAIGNVWIHGWKHSRAQNPVFFWGKVAVRGRCWRVSVSTDARLDPESGRQNVHETVARARFNIKIITNWRSWTTFWRWGQQNEHETVARARFHLKILKHWGLVIWRWGRQKCARDCSKSSISYVNHIIIK